MDLRGVFVSKNAALNRSLNSRQQGGKKINWLETVLHTAQVFLQQTQTNQRDKSWSHHLTLTLLLPV